MKITFLILPLYITKEHYYQVFHEISKPLWVKSYAVSPPSDSIPSVQTRTQTYETGFPLTKKLNFHDL
ncbi:hypothetical protein QQF64_020272 [Cirrhinus molitorella]|uniref:Uncharacterized protein n=1 Tax=Cirrhinus molitorella TaxID=172907 RepID=A0ABR3LC80_9TELE